MSDDWSLKDRDKFFTLIKRVKEIDMDVDIEYFDKEDIETLRQKLIEDIEKCYDDVRSCKNLDSVPIYWVTDIINKRFGAD